MKWKIALTKDEKDVDCVYILFSSNDENLNTAFIMSIDTAKHLAVILFDYNESADIADDGAIYDAPKYPFKIYYLENKINIEFIDDSVTVRLNDNEIDLFITDIMAIISGVKKEIER